jgi:hypothetical protein
MSQGSPRGNSSIELFLYKGTPQTGSHQIYYNRPLPGIAYVQCLGSLSNPGGLGEAGYMWIRSTLTPEQLRAGGFDPKGPSVPVCFTLPMGFCDSVYLTQQISQHLCRAFIPADRYVINNKDLASGPLAVIYIDDFALTCLAEHLPRMRRMDEAIGRRLETRAPTGERVQARGADIGHGSAGPSLRNTGLGPILSPTPERIRKLVVRTSYVLRQGSCMHGKEHMERLLGPGLGMEHILLSWRAPP